MRALAFAGILLGITGTEPWPDSVPFKPGDSLETVMKSLGAPTSQHRLTSFRPQLLNSVWYCNEGLNLGFHDSNGLYFVEFRKPWSKPVFGLILGTSLPAASKTHGLKLDESRVADKYYEWPEHPGWTVYSTAIHDTTLPPCPGFSLPNPGEPRPKTGSPEERVNRIRFIDWERRGKWNYR